MLLCFLPTAGKGYYIVQGYQMIARCNHIPEFFALFRPPSRKYAERDWSLWRVMVGCDKPGLFFFVYVLPFLGFGTFTPHPEERLGKRCSLSLSWKPYPGLQRSRSTFKTLSHCVCWPSCQWVVYSMALDLTNREQWPFQSLEALYDNRGGSFTSQCKAQGGGYKSYWEGMCLDNAQQYVINLADRQSRVGYIIVHRK